MIKIPVSICRILPVWKVFFNRPVPDQTESVTTLGEDEKTQSVEGQCVRTRLKIHTGHISWLRV
jgi:hypothetical protein